MAKGPARLRLDAALDAAEESRVETGKTQWSDASEKLQRVAEHITKAANLGLNEIQGDAGKQMFATMKISAQRLDDRAKDMRRGHFALRDTAQAIIRAKEDRDRIDQELQPHQATRFDPPEGYDDLPAWRQTEMRQGHEATQAGLAAQREQEREQRAQKIADDFEQDYQEPIRIMQDIYGYEPPPPPPTGDAPTPVYGPAGGSGTQSGVYHGPRDGGGGDGDGGDGGKDDPKDPDPTDPDPTDPDPTDPDPTDPGPTDPDPTNTTPPTSPWVDIPGGYGSETAAGGSGGSGSSISPAVLGAGAGVVTAGALGAAARSGLASAGVSSLRNLTSRGGPLGGTARGASSVLGKGGVGSTGSPTSARGAGAAGRGAGGLRSGAGTGAGAGRGGRGAGAGGPRSGAGAGGGRGGRGAGGRGAGVGAGRGRGKRDEEQQQGERDLFDDGQDWIDDEGAAPGVIS